MQSKTNTERGKLCYTVYATKQEPLIREQTKMLQIRLLPA
jgi:hypothetical protein